MTESSDSLAIGFCAWIAPIICRETGVSHSILYAAHYKHVHTFLKVNKLFNKLTITRDAQNIFLLLLNKDKVFSKRFRLV
jgi:hypothetical protein